MIKSIRNAKLRGEKETTFSTTFQGVNMTFRKTSKKKKK